MARPLRLLVTCEHGGNRVPARFRPLFMNRRALLGGHAGYDIGALTLARQMGAALAQAWPTRLVVATTSRLVVDLNRSVGHPQLHGAPVRALAREERAAIVARHYAPYRQAVERHVREAAVARARTVHLSCHSFTPSLHGRTRDADVGLLFDPARGGEARLARAWRRALVEQEPWLRVRMNYPYRGTADGLTTALRRRFAEADYVGLELEVNQEFPLGHAGSWRALRRCLIAALQEALATLASRQGPK